MKPYTSIKLSFFIAVFTLVITVILFYALNISTNSTRFFVFLIGSFASSFIISFLLIKVFFDKKLTKTNNIINSTAINNIKDSNNWKGEQQKEIETLKETEKFRKEFIGNLAHELKTPVFSVQGYILTLLEGGLEDETINRKFLKKASKGIDRIADVISDIDVITRIESDTLILDKKKFNIIDLIKDVFEDLEELAATKKTTLAVNNKKEDSVFVFADKSKITQVLANLILNSINYGNENGTTTININTNKTKIAIDVIDNGPGIENQHLPRLFERFYRVEKSRSRNKGGSGIGLAIVKHIIEAHQETITVKSIVDKGTSFSFTLPKI